MNSLISQVSYPVFLYFTFLFFLLGSIFSFFVGIALALRSEQALRFFDYMNRWVSVRKMMRPLSVPHDVEPALLKRRVTLGMLIVIGSVASILLLAEANIKPALSLFEGSLSAPEISGIAENLKGFLVVSNMVCLLVGLLILFFPKVLSTVENYTDRLYSMRKSTMALGKMHMEVDCWVLKHPTSAGLTLSILSVSVGILMFNYLQNITA
jgi:hypothetical protein